MPKRKTDETELQENMLEQNETATEEVDVVDDVMEEARNATNPFYRDCFDWEKKAYQ